MKQTNNAIKFLMAQYRAIFRNANLKMFLAAATAAAAMAATSAQAADLSNQLADAAKDAKDIVSSASGDELKIQSGTKYAKTVTVQKGADLTVSGNLSTVGDVNVNGGKLVVSGTSSSLFLGEVKKPAQDSTDTTARQHYQHDLKASAGSTIELNQANIGVANFDLKGTTVSLKSGGTGGTNLTAYGEGAYQKGDNPANLQYNAVSKLSDVTANIEGGTNITSIGILSVTGSSKDKSVINLKGLASGAGTHPQNLGYLGGSKQLIIDNTTINVKDGADKSKGTAVVSPDLKISNSKISVATGTNTLTLGGLTDRDSVGGSQVQNNSYEPGTAVISQTEIVNAGTLNLGHDNGAADTKTKTEFSFAGNTVNNTGVINAYGDVKVDSLKGWFGNDATKADSKLVLSGSTLTLTSNESLDLTTANIKSEGTQKNAIVSEKGSITLATGFEAKSPNVTASTIVVNTAVPQKGEPWGTKPDGRHLIFIKNGNVTALNEVKSAKSGGEILVYQPQANNSASLTLGTENTTNGKLVDIKKLIVGRDSGGSLEVNGKWDFGGARLTLGASGNATISSNAEVTNIDTIQMGGKIGESSLNIKGEATVKRLLAAENTGGSLNVSGTLNITGDGDITDEGPDVNKVYYNDVNLNTSALNILAGGTVALTTKDAWDDVLKVTTDSKTGVSTFEVVKSAGTPAENKVAEYGGWNKSKVDLAGGGTLRIDLSGYNIGTKTELEKLAGDLVKDGSKGLVDLGGIDFKLETNKDDSVDLANMPNVKTKATKDVVVNIPSDKTTLSGSLSMGSANVAGDTLTTASGTTIEFNKAKDGLFATNNTAPSNADKNVAISLDSGSAVILNGNGSIGDIKKTASANNTAAILGGANGTQTVGVVEVKDLDILGGNVTAKSISATGDTYVAGVLSVDGAISTSTLDLAEKSAIKAAGQDITVSGNSASVILGDIEAKSLGLSGNAIIAGNAKLDLELLKGATGKTIQVGDDDVGGLGATVVTDVLDLNSGSIFVDPIYGNKAAKVIVGTLPETTTGNTLNGNVIVGKNAAMGIGFGSQDEFDASIAQYVDAKGSFGSGDGQVHNALVVNESITIASNNGIVLDDSITKDTKPDAAKMQNVVSIAKGSNLIITDAALKDKTKAAITLSTAGEVKGDGTVSLAGDMYSGAVELSTAKLFAVTNNGTLKGVGNVTVSLADGLYTGKLTTSGTVDKFAIAPEKKAEIMSQTSAPVGDFLVKYTDPNNQHFEVSVGAGTKTLNSLIDAGNWSGVDALAHAATYAGAQQAAVAAVGTMAEAVGGRVGSLGVEATAITATGSAANGGVWVAPMYKSVDADGFAAEGASYGADVDLAGVAFGADTVNGNMRFGAVFNIGSGDSDGKGNGNGLKDEFDYYGFGIYSVMGFGDIAVVGDASLNVISHDVEGLGLKGSADTTAVTMGVTGQYTIASPMVDVTPHIGARFIRLDTESYDLTSKDGVVATTDFDVQNVFSVPLGVTLSKAFEMGGWSLAPSADLTIAFNTGDTEVKSNTQIAGVKHNMGLTTEVLDEVTYGINLGLGAQYGAFGTNIGLNYTGSENTDSFGVNAQARYMF